MLCASWQKEHFLTASLFQLEVVDVQHGAVNRDTRFTFGWGRAVPDVHSVRLVDDRQEHLADVYRHLTNYSINKGAENFQENQRVQADNYGHKWSLSALNRHLRCVGVDVKEMWSRIMDLIVKTLLGVEPVISAATKEACIHEHSCFELYGFDVLVDESLKPWLLEVNLSPSMQADSPLDKQIKSTLLTDAFNLIGVRKLDASTLTSARLRARFLYMNKLQKSMPSKSSSLLGHRQDPLRRPETEESEGAAGEDGASSPPRPPRRFFSHKRQVALDMLGETQLKLLGDTLQESLRCNNFIRLYPTPFTLRRYEGISQLRMQEDEFRAQLLVAVLYARQLPTFCREPHPPEEEPELIQETPADAAEAKKVIQLPSTSNMKIMEEALQTLKVLGSKMSSQLLLMEYLVRLLNISSKLSDAARRKLESPQQTAIAGVISVFRQQLSLWLRGSKKQPPPPQNVVKKGDVLEEAEDVCLQALVQILCDTWGGSREAVMKSVAAIRSELALVRIAPEPFVRSSSGCRAIKALGDLTATDMEAIFRAPQCPPELKCIFLVPEPDEQMAAGIGWHVLRRMSQAGPLSELEFLQHVMLQPPLPKNNVVQPGETPPLNPRMMMSASSPTLQKRARPAGPLAPLGHRLPFPSGVAYSRKSMLALGTVSAVSHDIEL
ncbi:Ttll5 [Symbiodinium sp. CCMP2456]|nr:Ttll5 [Symbiodinium sp. CCMP2456]